MAKWLRNSDGERIDGPCSCCPDLMGHSFGLRESLRCATCSSTWEQHRADPQPCPAPFVRGHGRRAPKED